MLPHRQANSDGENDGKKPDPVWMKRDSMKLIQAFLGATVFLVIGALILAGLEFDEHKQSLVETKARIEDRTAQSIRNIIMEALEAACGQEQLNSCAAAVNFTRLEDQAIGDLNALSADLGSNNFQLNRSDSNVTPDWDYVGAFYFCITTVTSIGYGNFTPATRGGRLFTIFYILIGVPMFLYLCSQFSRLYSYVFFLLRTYFNVDKHCCRLMVYYLVVFGVLFTLIFLVYMPILMFIEEMDPIAAFYFVMSTLSTVGYGDFYPNDPVEEHEASLRVLYSLVLWVYMVLALSFFGNVMKLIQEYMDRVHDYYAKHAPEPGADAQLHVDCLSVLIASTPGESQYRPRPSRMGTVNPQPDNSANSANQS